MSTRSSNTLAMALCLAGLAPLGGVHAQQASQPGGAGVAELPAVRVEGGGIGEADDGFNTLYAPAAVNKSRIPLSETPQSITVVPRSVLDSQQAQTLADALHNVPGVVANNYGRRGWDDLIIRGQTASDSLFVDGLRTAVSNRVAEQLFGMEQVEVLKGPASLLYGQVLPGGLVNMVSKRPQPHAFANAEATVGSHAFRQGTIDLGTPLSDSGRAAFRLNGLAMNADDATDHVWFRSRWIAPSLSLDLGPRTDFTILTSYQERHYIRQQGLPLRGSVLPNPLGQIPIDRFTGEPGQDPYNSYQTRVGYALTHRFDSGWTVNQNLRWQEFTLDGALVANGNLGPDNRTLPRTATDQHWDGNTLSVDTNAQRTFETGFGAHEITVGTDYVHTREYQRQFNCSVGTLDVFDPVYGSPISCPALPNSDQQTSVRMLGFYVRDQVRLGRWTLVGGLRHDDASTYSDDFRRDARSDNPARATTGSAAIMYEVWPGVRPYISYATSFYPNTGTDAQGDVFDPEKGRQWEAGVKFDLDGGATGITVAAFDLRRRNVLEDDPLNDGFSVAVGEQRTRGGELSFTSDLGNGLSVYGGYAYTAAVITDDGGQAQSTEGQWLDNVPRHSFNLWARYRLRGPLQGWDVNGGVRGESARRVNAAQPGYVIPGYAVADLGVGYTAANWRAALTVRNLFDKEYYAGGLRSAVAVGDTRTYMLTLGYRY